MAITSRKQDRSKQQESYPILKKSINYNRIVLFIAPNNGIVVYDNSKFQSCNIGYHSTTFDETLFIDFDGKVVLENEK